MTLVGRRGGTQDLLLGHKDGNGLECILNRVLRLRYTRSLTPFWAWVTLGRSYAVRGPWSLVENAACQLLCTDLHSTWKVRSTRLSAPGLRKARLVFSGKNILGFCMSSLRRQSVLIHLSIRMPPCEIPTPHPPSSWSSLLRGLRPNLPGMLWVVCQCRLWFRAGLGPPDSLSSPLMGSRAPQR